MSKKRSREETTIVPSLSTLPYSTIEGGRWLKKALDPVDINTDIAGLPDINTNQRAILNYQMQADIPVPRSDTYNPNINQSYDADLYLLQDPICYGMSVSYPQNTLNPVGVDLTLAIQRSEIRLALPAGYAPRTCNIFLNNQIEGDCKYNKLQNLQKYCQRCRMVYGGIQAIPACSALFDSGTIEATQQIFSPENALITDMGVTKHDGTNEYGIPYRCQRFKEDDFPDNGSSIQNATSLYCRYKEGLYMPYKMVNPLVYPYRGAEDLSVTDAPYVFSDITKVWITYVDTNTVDYANPVVSTKDLSAVYSPEEHCFVIDTGFTESQNTIQIKGFHMLFECYNKVGARFYIQFASGSMSEPGTENDDMINSSYKINLPKTLGAYYHPITGGTSICQPVTPPTPFNGVAARRVYGGSGLVADGTVTSDNIASVDFYLPQSNTNIGIVCFRSIGLQASIRLIFRFGLEMMIVAGGVYSPFKHKAPNYDQKALNTYVRAIHKMKDAFLGNAATPEGHPEFSARIAEIVAEDDSRVSVSNLGSRWYGKVNL